MFCPNCGKDLPQNGTFCPECGAKINIRQEQFDSAPVENQEFQYGNIYEEPVSPDAGKVDFKTAVKLFFKNYANFEGRSTKSEYWWAYLFTLLASFAAGFVPLSSQFNYLAETITVNYLSSIVSVALFIPSLAVAVRRLHDTGKSWKYMFINLIPIVGWILYIVQLCKDSDGDNEWGPRSR